MSLREKLIIPGLAIALVLFAVIVIMLFWATGRADLQRKKVEFYNQKLVEILALRDLIGGQTRQVQRILHGDETVDSFEETTRKIEGAFAELEYLIEQEGPQVDEESKSEMISELDSLEEEYGELHSGLTNAISKEQAADEEGAESEYGAALRFYEGEFLRRMNRMMSTEVFEIERSQEETESAFTLLRILASVIAGIAILVTILIILVLHLNIGEGEITEDSERVYKV